MKLVLLTHYTGFQTVSMPLFARVIADGMKERGHLVNLWLCPVWFGRISLRGGFGKWLGYIDQFIIFPVLLCLRLCVEPKDTLFVVTDHALGPWIPAISHRRHVIHCHDFLAQRSALGEVEQNPTGFSGRWYQWLIRRGYCRGKNFISVSQSTQRDLHRFLQTAPRRSEVVYNGLNYPYRPLNRETALAMLKVLLSPDEERKGFILHVGGNQWYKNRRGVLEIYAAYVSSVRDPLPLCLVGREPAEDITALVKAIKAPGQVRVLSGLETSQVHAAYCLASVLLFPSLAEGFGWPIAEAMACGCPVLTTDAPPMNEVASEAAILLPVRPLNNSEAWAIEGARQLEQLLSNSQRISELRKAGLTNAQRFYSDKALDAYNRIYTSIS